MAVLCYVCGKYFVNQGSLNRHRKEVHHLEAVAVQFDADIGSSKCLEGCEISYKCAENLRNHLQTQHSIIQEYVEKTFSTFSEFEVWLKLEEKDHNVRYNQTKRKVKDVAEKGKTEIIYFNCARSGKSRIIPECSRKRKLKTQGSSKINYSCTSQIIVNIFDDICLIKYYKTHYAHGKDLQHLQISKAGREMIASKLAIGVSKNHIIDSVRDHISNDLKRDDLVTNEDLKNIRNAYNIHLKDGYRHKNDRISVQLRVEEWNQWVESPILLYKQQDLNNETIPYNLKKEDFCLIYMNALQKQLLSKFGSNIVCVDSTHGLNQYDFEMTTVLIIDEFGHGFPCAFMFTNRKDTYVFEIFFSEIKKALGGTIRANVFMTDVTGVFCNAWVKVMGSVERQLYCAWHIDKAWQQNLKKISDTEDRNWVYKTLKYLQTLLIEEQFEQEFKKFLVIIKTKCKPFFEYIVTYYAPHTMKWAYCYRKKAGINTNMHIENMHRIIKHIYFDGKCVRRLDKSLNVLEKLVRDKTIDRVIKLTKGKHTEHSNAIYNRHRAAVVRSFELKVVSDSSYIVKKAENDNCYSVVKVNSAVCCALICKFCDICIHTYECTCMDYNVKYTICEHIHYVHLKIRDHTVNLNCNNLEANNVEIKNLISNLDHQQLENNYQTLTDKIKSMAYQIVQNVDSSAHSVDRLEQMAQGLKSVLLLSNLPPDAIKSNATSVKNIPANKKIDKQKFFSTKKKSSRNIFNRKPNDEEASVIKELLTESIFTTSDTNNDHKYT